MSELQTSSFPENLDERGNPRLPKGLNILTILTFIGCGLGLLFVIATPMLNNFFLKMMDNAQRSGAELTAEQLKEMEDGRAVIALTQANMVPIVAISLIGIALCLIGALWMRKLKKDGYWMYLGGELFPLAGSFIILGTAQYTNAVSIIIGVGIPLLFVVLYTMQRKHLVK